jgi:hypothetical protein
MRYGSPAQTTQDAALALRSWYRSRLRAGRCGDPFVYPLSALKTSTFKLGRRESSDAQSAVTSLQHRRRFAAKLG